jgi:lipopolysaccharide transport system ATP-binding protein
MSVVLKIENLWKDYRLGVFGQGMLFRDVQSWVARIRGREDPNMPVGKVPGNNVRGDRIWALRDVSLKVREGEVLGIIGHNGAGKSTLLKLVTKVTAPTRGTIKIRGRVASLLEVGTGFHPELTGRENVFLNGAILGMTVKEIKRKFDEIVDFSGVEKYIDTPVKRYSSGMHVRLAFAVAAHLESEILLVDEVLAVGDAGFQRKCLGKMRGVSEQGRTILFVSHNMRAVLGLCKRSIRLQEGRTVSDGPSEKLVHDYYESLAARTDEEIKRESSELNLFRLKLVRLFDDDGNELLNLQSGAPVNLEFDYDCSPEIRSEKVIVTVSVGNAADQSLFICPQEIQRIELQSIPLTGTIVCRLASFPLVSGYYALKYGALVNSLVTQKSQRFVHVVDREDFGNQDEMSGATEQSSILRKRGQFVVDFQWCFRTSLRSFSNKTAESKRL